MQAITDRESQSKKLGHNCHENDNGAGPNELNHEIHPVYSIDLIQDWTNPPRTFADLTGVWNGINCETWYTRQIGNQFWALVLSRDQGQTFSRVFHGSFPLLPTNGQCSING